MLGKINQTKRLSACYCVFIGFLILLNIQKLEASPVVVQVLGLRAEDKKQVLAGLSIAQTQSEQTISETRVRSLHERAPNEIAVILTSLGYYHPTIDSHLAFYKKKWQAIYYIKPGDPILTRTARIEIIGPGKDTKELVAFKKQVLFPTGNRLTHSHYEEIKNGLLRTALQIGYLDAMFQSAEMRIHRVKNFADVILVLETGPQYYFGPVNFTDSKYPQSFLQQYITFKIGEPYRTDPLSELQKNLTESDLFSKVRINPEIHHHTDRVIPLNINLTDRPQTRYHFGVGFDSERGGRGKMGIERKLLHRPGHRIHLGVQTSGITAKPLKSHVTEQKGHLEYIIPGKHPSTDRVSFGILGKQERFKDKRLTREIDLSVTDTKKINQLERQWSLHYLSTIFTDGDTPKKHTTFLLPTVDYVWTQVKTKEPPLFGHRIGITLKGGLGSLFSSSNLLQGQFKWKWVHPVATTARLLIRTDIGTVVSDKKHQIPPTLRFYAGGDNTVRGFAYKSLGPVQVDSSGKEIVVGGRHLLASSIEIDKEFYHSFRGAIFVDTGNAMNHWNQRLVTSSGIGLRYGSPLGEFRLDVARPMSKGYRKKYRIHLTFGTDL